MDCLWHWVYHITSYYGSGITRRQPLLSIDHINHTSKMIYCPHGEWDGDYGIQLYHTFQATRWWQPPCYASARRFPQLAAAALAAIATGRRATWLGGPRKSAELPGILKQITAIINAIFWGYIPWNLGLKNRPYTVYGRYLQWIGSWNGHWYNNHPRNEDLIRMAFDNVKLVVWASQLVQHASFKLRTWRPKLLDAIGYKHWDLTIN